MISRSGVVLNDMHLAEINLHLMNVSSINKSNPNVVSD